MIHRNYYHAYAYDHLGTLQWDYVITATWVGGAITELQRELPTDGLDIMILDPQGNIRGRLDNRPLHA